MEEIGIFPLPLVLLPTEALPLHIFEPRYRELIGECLEHGGELAIVLEENGRRRDIGTAAVVAEVLRRYDEGKLDVVVRGTRRLQLLAETSGRSFRTARVTEQPDEDDPAGTELIASCLAAFRQAAEAAGVDPATESLSPDSVPGLSYVLAARVAFAAGVRQQLLELRSERERLVLLVELLGDVRTSLMWQTTVRERASTNGHAPRPDS